MTGSKDIAIVWSDRLRIPRLFGCVPQRDLTTILFHSFRFGEETWADVRERLRRQLDFLASGYQPVNLGQALDFVREGKKRGERQVLVTVDDAKRDILEVYDLFQSFGVPVAQFVCSGWSERAPGGHQAQDDAVATKARLVSYLHFSDAPPQKVVVGDSPQMTDQNGNVALIDRLIDIDDPDELARLEGVLGPVAPAGDICTWSELRDLQSQGMEIGCHSVSHPQIARQSAKRQRYEICESRRLIEANLGPSPWFAYPYGTSDSEDAGTLALLREQGFRAGFTTAGALALQGDDSLRLPRIVLPDVPMSDAVFKARVHGGGIPLSRLKGVLS